MPPAQETAATKPLPLKVVGTQLLDSAGNPVRLRGVNTASHGMDERRRGGTSSRPSRPPSATGTPTRSGCRCHRTAGSARRPSRPTRASTIASWSGEIVDAVAAQGCYIILDLHWSNAGEWGKNIGQHCMPDENSLSFWKDVAAAYKNHPAVLFNLYNEPHNVGWDIWLNGGQVTEKATRKTPIKTYKAVGMQTLLEAVRSTGAKNVVIVGGLDWAYDFSGILKGRQLSDPDGNGVLYDNHAYPFKGDTVERWIAKMETAAKNTADHRRRVRRRDAAEVAVVEKDEQWVRQVLQALEDHKWNWTAWDMHPGAGPRLISDFPCSPRRASGNGSSRHSTARCHLMCRLRPRSAGGTHPAKESNQRATNEMSLCPKTGREQKPD